jgi:hypothetical protein
MLEVERSPQNEDGLCDVRPSGWTSRETIEAGG